MSFCKFQFYLACVQKYFSFYCYDILFGAQTLNKKGTFPFMKLVLYKCPNQEKKNGALLTKKCSILKSHYVFFSHRNKNQTLNTHKNLSFARRVTFNWVQPQAAKHKAQPTSYIPIYSSTYFFQKICSLYNRKKKEIGCEQHLNFL